MFMKRLALLTFSAAALFTVSGCAALGKVKDIVDELNKTPDELPMTQEQVRKGLVTYAEQHNGLQFEYMFRAGEKQGTGYVGQKDGNLWEVVEVEDEKIGYVALKQEDGSLDRYYYQQDQSGFVFDKNLTNYDAQDVAKYFGNYGETSWLLFAHSQSLTKKEADEVLGRPCTVYDFTYSGLANQFGEETNFHIWVDDELCITMKIDISSSSSSSSNMNMDMTAMKTGAEVSAPEVLPKATEETPE